MKKTCLLISLAILSLGSCATSKNIFQTENVPTDFENLLEIVDESQQDEVSQIDEQEKIFTLLHRGLKIEAEEMDLVGCNIFDDGFASNKMSVAFEKDSKASTKIILPTGEYEILFSQKAFSTSGSHIKVTVEQLHGDNEIYKSIYETYPSEPPLGRWEMTVRKPIFIANENPSSPLTITVEAMEWDKKSSKEFYLDFFQVVRLD